jgi:hypothetical protein
MTQQNGWYQASDGQWYPAPPGFAPAADPYAADPYASGPYAPPPASSAWIAWVVVGVVVFAGLAVAVMALFFSAVNSHREATVQRFPLDVTMEPYAPDVEGPDVDPAAWHGRVGQPGTLTKDSRTVDVVTVTAVRAAVALPDLPRPENGRFLLVSVRIDGTDTLTVNPYDFEVRTGGRLFRFNAGHADSSTLDDVLYQDTVFTGERLAGRMMFDVPPGHGEVVWTPAPGTSFTWAY